MSLAGRFLAAGGFGQRWLVPLRRARRRMLATDRRMRDGYLRREAEPKLHVGSGQHVLDGWLNTDIDLVSDVVQMDATRAFPFADRTFKYIFSEHMIEHVPFADGQRMLRECHRVLREDGVLRIATPNLLSLVALFGEELTETQGRYLDWFKVFLAPGEPPNAAGTINVFFRAWGHQFIYDEKTLSDALSTAGFRVVERWSLGESNEAGLRGLENERRYPEGLLAYETIVLEARK